MKKKIVVLGLAFLLICGTFGLSACGGSKYGDIDLSKSLAAYGSILTDEYAVNGAETTIKARVRLSQNKDAYMEIAVVIAPAVNAGEGSSLDNDAVFKSVEVVITGADKEAYEEALSDSEEAVEYNNPEKLTGKKLSTLRENRTVTQAVSGVYDFVTADGATEEINAVGIASIKAIDQIVGYYRFVPLLKTTFGSVVVKANRIEVSSDFESQLALIDEERVSGDVATPSVEITNVWETEDSYLIVADSRMDKHGQNIVILLQIGKSDNKIKKAIAPFYHVSEYLGNNAPVYVGAINTNLAALIGVEIDGTAFGKKGSTGSIADITTSATLTTNTTTNAVNAIIEYYFSVIKA